MVAVVEEAVKPQRPVGMGVLVLGKRLGRQVPEGEVEAASAGGLAAVVVAVVAVVRVEAALAQAVALPAAGDLK